jgi:hypothetical protein
MQKEESSHRTPPELLLGYSFANSQVNTAMPRKLKLLNISVLPVLQNTF